MFMLTLFAPETTLTSWNNFVVGPISICWNHLPLSLAKKKNVHCHRRRNICMSDASRSGISVSLIPVFRILFVLFIRFRSAIWLNNSLFIPFYVISKLFENVPFVRLKRSQLIFLKRRNSRSRTRLYKSIYKIEIMFSCYTTKWPV